MFYRRQLKPENARAVLQTAMHTSIEPTIQSRTQTIDTLARTLWDEARGESLTGIEAVACVILNRVKTAQRRGSMWWGNTIDAVCLKPYQFSCWNAGDPNLPKLQSVTVGDPTFAICHRIAQRAVNGVLNDITNGADHYHAPYVSPHWAASQAPVATIGNHIFYKLEH